MGVDGVDQPDREKTEREKAIDEWLPVSASRTAKWWYSAFHNVTAMVGAGVLSLPYAMSNLGWGPGITLLVLSWMITLYTLWQMVEMHETVPGKRFDRYHELGQHAFGEKLGLYIVVPQQIVVDVSTCIIYMVTGGKSIQKIWNAHPQHHAKLTLCIGIFAIVQFVLSLCPNFNSLSVVSFVAAIMSLAYSTIAWTASLGKGVTPNVSYELRGSSSSANTFNFFNAMGDIAFAYAGHNVVLEIQATIPSSPDNPSKKPMWKGVIFAYIVVAICYAPVAFFGYYTFGNLVDDNILLTLEKPTWLIASANAFVFVHVLGGYQVYAMPVFDMLESFLVKSMNCKPSKLLRLGTRTVYVGITMFMGMTFPFFGGLLGFFGGFALAPTSYYLPCIIWLIVKKPKRFSISWCINWTCIVLGVILMILAPIGGMRNIILSAKAKTYKFYQ
ncbi:lysine histidine transporter 2 [Phtheirospermum japonicum]|uniref:Lysine histidine transporter 2 n=1 Tax=Phtheirospermum japonicum TaxID=374723 RepID=A0A830BR61_9LAMI|nr:lysine histidine transporter 2 [Phtheirospermum japonicum]